MTQESPVWVTGLLVSAFTFVLTMVGMFAFGESLMEINVILAFVLLVVIIGGSSPTLWRFRQRPVMRWVFYGVVSGIAAASVGLIGLLVFAP